MFGITADCCGPCSTPKWLLTTESTNMLQRMPKKKKIPFQKEV